MNKGEIDKKIEEFFFDPSMNPNKYGKVYINNNWKNKEVRISPLYLARKDINYYFGLNSETLKKMKVECLGLR